MAKRKRNKIPQNSSAEMKVDGKDAFIVYLDKDLVPCDKSQAVFSRVRFLESGDTMLNVHND